MSRALKAARRAFMIKAKEKRQGRSRCEKTFSLKIYVYFVHSLLLLLLDKVILFEVEAKSENT